MRKISDPAAVWYGQNDLPVLVRGRDELIPDRYDGAIDAIDSGYELDRPMLYGLVYLFDGKQFTLDEGSKETLDETNALLDRKM